MSLRAPPLLELRRREDAACLRSPLGSPGGPPRPLLMAETGVWAPCESPAHAASTASSTVDADLMVTDGDRVVVDKKQKTFTIRPQATGC